MFIYTCSKNFNFKKGYAVVFCNLALCFVVQNSTECVVSDILLLKIQYTDHPPFWTLHK